MQIAWKPNKGRQTFALSQIVFELLYGGARGGGKTDAGIAWMSRPIEHPLYRGLVIRRNSTDLEDWVDRAQRTYANMGGVKAGSPAVFTFPSGAKIRTGHLKDENAYTKYQGHEYQRILIEELTHIPRYSDYEKLKGSCRSTVDGLDSRLFATTNPGEIGHYWVKDYFVDVIEPMKPYKDPISGRLRMFVPATVDDNPILMEKDPEYVKTLDALKDIHLKRAWRDGSWDDPEIKGAYYANQFKQIKDEYRITHVPFDPMLDVHTAWDLGKGDNMAIWLFQRHGSKIRLIDYLSGEGQGMEDYIRILREYKEQLGYIYGRHYGPHDLRAGEIWKGKTRFEMAQEIGFEFTIVPKLGLEDGIDAVRRTLPFCYFDTEKTKVGYQMLQSYRKKWDEKHNIFLNYPVHDASSHPADAFRYLSLGIEEEEPMVRERKQRVPYRDPLSKR